jgi:L-serine dehydratase
MRFKDVFSIIGPAMIGPSSSHTAGAVRLGRVARSLLKGIPEQAEITFYGSFAETYRGHGTDAAIVGGMLGFDTADPRIPQSLEIAERQGISIQFVQGKGRHSHPNTARLRLSASCRTLDLVGASIGGGSIEIQTVNGFDVKFTGIYPTLIIAHLDRKGFVADVARLLSDAGINIGYMVIDRRERGGDAMTAIEADSPISDEVVRRISGLPAVYEVNSVDLREGDPS